MKRILTNSLRSSWPLQTTFRRGFDLDPSCKLWLPFYKYGAEQSKIWDQSGNSNHGTITGAVPTTPLGWSFDGVDDVVTIGDASSLVIGTGNCTILAWVRSNNIPESTQNIIGTGASNNPEPGWCVRGMYAGAGYQIYQFLVSDDVIRKVKSTEGTFTSLVPAVWTHLACSITHHTSLVAAVDGVDMTALDISTVANSITNTTAPVIGASAANGAFKGNIGEMLFFNRALSVLECKNHFELTRHIYGV